MTLHRGKILALAGYLAIVALVAGGLAWVTHAALHLEQSELQLRHSDTVRLALWTMWLTTSLMATHFLFQKTVQIFWRDQRQLPFLYLVNIG